MIQGHPRIAESSRCQLSGAPCHGSALVCMLYPAHPRLACGFVSNDFQIALVFLLSLPEPRGSSRFRGVFETFTKVHL